MSDFSRSQRTRQRREYLYRKGQEHRLAQIQERKQKVKNFVDNDKTMPGDIRNMALNLARSSQWEDNGPEMAAMIGTADGAMLDDIDDEYRHAGEEDPKIFLTTSHNPSSRLKMFAKEMKLILPNSERMNRGNIGIKTIISSAKQNGFTDVVILHETRGRPDHMIVSHLPNGPTAYFTLYDVKLRHDIPDCGTMSEAYPHTCFENFTTRLGQRIVSVLKYLFPVPKDDSQRMMAFVNHTDFIHFRHVVERKSENGKTIGITEVGPQFRMQCHKIIRATLEEEAGADVEYVVRPYLNTAHKKMLLSNEFPFKGEDLEAMEENGETVPDKQRDVAK